MISFEEYQCSLRPGGWLRVSVLNLTLKIVSKSPHLQFCFIKMRLVQRQEAPWH